MNEIINWAADLLHQNGYVVEAHVDTDSHYMLFESDQSIGLLLAFADPALLLQGWRNQSEQLLGQQKLGLRRSLEKAWNSYLAVLSGADADRLQQALLDSVEEDLIGTRKIARAGIRSREAAARALLPLLPLQSPPNLQPVDMKEEIRIRASELPAGIMDAFLTGRDTQTVMQLLEEM